MWSFKYTYVVEYLQRAGSETPEPESLFNKVERESRVRERLES